MTIKKYLAVFLSACIFGLLCFTIGFDMGSKGDREGRAAIIAKASSTEESLTKWVYSKSTKISVDTAKQIVKECLKTEKPLLTIALISVESEFVSSAVSNVGAIGLGQTMFGLHSKELIKAGIVKERRDLFNISNSVKATDLLINRFISESKGDLSKALERYQGGFNTYYISRILSNLGSLYILTEGGH